MRDLLETFFEFLFHVTADLCNDREPRTIAGIVSIAMAVLIAGSCLIRMGFGQQLDAWDLWLALPGCLIFLFTGLWFILARGK